VVGGVCTRLNRGEGERRCYKSFRGMFVQLKEGVTVGETKEEMFRMYWEMYWV
jgi:hypothetical protein